MLNKVAHKFRGYVSAKFRHECAPDELNSSSQEWGIEPIQQKLVRRRGSSIVGDALSFGDSVSGILETKSGYRAEQLGSLSSASLTDGYPTYGCLYTKESAQIGTFYWRSTNSGGSNQQLGIEFGSTHYSTAASTVVDMKIPPYYAEDGTLGRWISSTQRKKALSGCRQWMEHGNWCYFPTQGTPLRWNKRFNDATNSGSEKFRAFPWGNLPPLNLGRGQLTAASADGTDNNWKDGDSYFYSILFEYEDGSLSRPFEPRAKGTSTCTGTTSAANVTTTITDLKHGFIQLGTIGGASYYKKITYTSIPLGPEGCVARWLLRSDKVNVSSATSLLSIGPLELGVIARIGNNTSTSYEDSNGTSTTGSDRIRFDSIWPPRCQYVVGSDGRTVIGGNIKPNPGAVIIAPVAFSAWDDVNKDDDSSSIFGSTQAFVRVTASTVILEIGASGGSFPCAITTDLTITTTSKTIQQLVDEINESTGISANHIRWGAQLVPGADPTTLATNLFVTSAVSDFGDDGMLSGGTSGNMRVFSNSYPGILYFSSTYLATLKTDTQSVIMTGASPTTPGGNANSWFSDKASNWKAPPHATVGRLMGMAPITGQAGVVCIVFYEKARYVLRNIRGGGTGEDADYRLLPLNTQHGCVNHRTITVGPGVVGCMDDLGYVFSDAQNEQLVSLDVWNTDLQRGEWAAEMTKALAGAASGLDQNSYFHASIIDATLWISYRSDNSLTYCDRRIPYRFLEGNEASGLAAVLRQSSQSRPVPYGWGAPIKAQKISVVGSYRNGTGLHKMGAIETNAGTNDGRIDEWDTGYQDNSVSFTSDGYIGCTPAEAFQVFNPINVHLRYYKPASGLTLTLYRDGVTNQGLRSDSYSLTPASSGSNLYADLQTNLPNAAQADSAVVEWKITDDGSNSTAPEIYELNWTAEVHTRNLPT